MAGVRSRRVLIECGAAETRSALLFGDEVIRFWFGPARGDESMPRPPESGDIYLGRVRTVSTALNGAFVDIGAERDAFLAFRNEESLVEGASVIVRVRRPQVGDKGALVTSNWAKGADADATERHAAATERPGRLRPVIDAAVRAVAALSGDGKPQVIVNDASAEAALRGDGVTSLTIERDPFERFGADEALEQSLDRLVRLDGGAGMIIDETEAMTTVDIDTIGAADGATGRLNDKVNAAAARRLFPELSRRGIGGRVIVDFLPSSSADARRALMEQLRTARRDIFDCRLGRLSSDGLFDLTAPRDRLTLLSVSTELADKDLVRPGRRFTLDWQAKAAVRALERRLLTRPAARISLFAGAAVTSYLQQRPQWSGRVAARFGSRFQISEKATLPERDFDISE